MLFIYLFAFTSILSHIQGGAEEMLVFHMASTWQEWGWWRWAWAGGQLRQCSFSSHGTLECRASCVCRRAVHSNAPWLLKLHCVRCVPAHTQHHQLHPCRVLAIWKTCVFSAPPCSNIGLVQNYTSKIKTNYL
jgi:hypothetical protein